MAIYHCHISNVSRAGGSSSCASYAYQSGEKVYDERQGQTYSYGREERILATGTILPENAPAEFEEDPAVMFNSIEQHLTADNARTAKKIEVALPNELPLEEQKQIIDDYIRANLTSQGYAVSYAIHSDGKNDHAHFLIPNRPIDEQGKWIDGQTKTTFANDRDEKGKPIFNPDKPAYDPKKKEETKQYRIAQLDKDGNQKFRERKGKGKEMLWERVNIEENKIDTKEFLQGLRKNWALEVNKHLEPERQIDHRSHKERGLEDKPTIHEGYAARKMEERGEISDRCQTNREILAENKERREIRQELESAQKEMELLNQKERELHERMGRIRATGRGKTDGYVGDIAEGKRGPEATPAPSAPAPDDGTVIENNKTAGTRDWTAELIAHRRAITEREIARISKEREEAKRRELETQRENSKPRTATLTKERTTTQVIDTGRGFGR